MSASGPKQTWPIALHMSAIGGKADMTVCGNPLLRSLLGVKRTLMHGLIIPSGCHQIPRRTLPRLRGGQSTTAGDRSHLHVDAVCAPLVPR